MLALRVVSGAVLIPILIGLVFLGDPWYSMAVSVAVVLGLVEIALLLRGAGIHPNIPVMLLLGLAFPVDATGWFGSILPGAIAISVVIVLGMLMFRPHSDGALLDWALTLTPPLYVGGLLQYFIPLRQASDGPFWPICVLALSWCCDTAAYAFGRMIGRHKLAPHLSPTKTWEGAIAGIVATLLASAAVSVTNGRPMWHLIGFGAVIALATVIGDLMESFVKRQVGAKDSGVLIPGHGGILDRMDSLLLSAAAAYGYQVLTNWGHVV